MAPHSSETQHKANRLQDPKLLSRRNKPRQLLPASRPQGQQIPVTMRV